MGFIFNFGDEYGIRIRECCRERAVCSTASPTGQLKMAPQLGLEPRTP